MALGRFHRMDPTPVFVQENAGFVGKFLQNKPATLFHVAVAIDKVAFFHLQKGGYFVCLAFPEINKAGLPATGVTALAFKGIQFFFELAHPVRLSYPYGQLTA